MKRKTFIRISFLCIFVAILAIFTKTVYADLNWDIRNIGWHVAGRPTYANKNSPYLQGNHELLNRLRASYTYNTRLGKIQNSYYEQALIATYSTLKSPYGVSPYWDGVTYTNNTPDGSIGYTKWYDSPSGVILDYLTPYSKDSTKNKIDAQGSSSPVNDMITFNDIFYGSSDTAYVASNIRDLADAKTAAIMQASGKNFPIYLDGYSGYGNDIDGNVVNALNSKGVRNIYVLGGSEIFSDSAGLSSGFNLIRAGGYNRGHTQLLFEALPSSANKPIRYQPDDNGIVFNGQSLITNNYDRDSIYINLVSYRDTGNSYYLRKAMDVALKYNIGNWKLENTNSPLITVGVNTTEMESYAYLYYNEIYDAANGYKAYAYNVVLPEYFERFQPKVHSIGISGYEYKNPDTGEYWVKTNDQFNINISSKIKSESNQQISENRAIFSAVSFHNTSHDSSTSTWGNYDTYFNNLGGSGYRSSSNGYRYLSTSHYIEAKDHDKTFSITANTKSTDGTVSPVQPSGIVVRTDGSNPTVSFDPDGTLWGKDSVSVKITTSDTGSGIDYSKVWLQKNGEGWVAQDDNTSTINLTTSGIYDVIVEAIDKVGNTSGQISKRYHVDKSAPTGVAKIENADYDGYDVYIRDVSDWGSGIAKIQVPTWTSHNGQDDLASDWDTNSAVSATNLGEGTWKFRVNIKDHNWEYGVYNSHVYMYDNVGNYRCYELSVDLKPPKPNATKLSVGNYEYFDETKNVYWVQHENPFYIYQRGYLNNRFPTGSCIFINKNSTNPQTNFNHMSTLVKDAPNGSFNWTHESNVGFNLLDNSFADRNTNGEEYNLYGYHYLEAEETMNNQLFYIWGATEYRAQNDALFTSDYMLGDFKLAVDAKEPSGTFTPKSKTWTNSPVDVSFDPSDGESGVKRWRHSISSDDGSTWSTWSPYVDGDVTKTIQIPNTFSKTYKIKVEVEDMVGNKIELKSDSYQIDVDAPIVTVDPSTVDWVNKNITVSISASDPLSGVNKIFYKIDTQNLVSPSSGFSEEFVNDKNGNVDVTLTQNGVWYIWYYSSDRANTNNASEIKCAGPFKIDKQISEISFSVDEEIPSRIFSGDGVINKASENGIDEGSFGIISINDNSLSGIKNVQYCWNFGSSDAGQTYQTLYNYTSGPVYQTMDFTVEKPVGDNLYLFVKETDISGNLSTAKFGPYEDPIKLSGLQITDIRDPIWDEVFWKDADFKEPTGKTFKMNDLPIDENSNPIYTSTITKKGYAFYFDITSNYLYRDADRIEILANFYHWNGVVRTPVDMYYQLDNNPFIKVGSSNDKLSLNLDTKMHGLVKIGELSKITLTRGVRIEKGVDFKSWKDNIQYSNGKIQWWYGKYLIPSTAKFVRKGDFPMPDRILSDGSIIINFEIIGYKNGIETFSKNQIYNYNNYMSSEGGPKNTIYRKGDMILYNNSKSLFENDIMNKITH